MHHQAGTGPSKEVPNIENIKKKGTRVQTKPVNVITLGLYKSIIMSKSYASHSGVYFSTIFKARGLYRYL
jgi:hypothetical protein